MKKGKRREEERKRALSIHDEGRKGGKGNKG